MINQHLSEFQMIGSSVRKLNIQNDFIAIRNDEQLERKLDVSHSVDSVREDNGKWIGILTLNIRIAVSSGKKQYGLDVSMEGCFMAPTAMGQEKFTQMMQVNGITSMYSIARGFVQSVTAQTLATGSVLLPMFNVLAYSQDLNGKEASEKESQPE